MKKEGEDEEESTSERSRRREGEKKTGKKITREEALGHQRRVRSAHDWIAALDKKRESEKKLRRRQVYKVFFFFRPV